jgi:hypothetical protein
VAYHSITVVISLTFITGASGHGGHTCEEYPKNSCGDIYGRTFSLNYGTPKFQWFYLMFINVYNIFSL